MEDQILGVLFMIMGFSYVYFYKKLAVLTEKQNRKFFRITIPLRSYEQGLKIGGIALILFGIATLLKWV